MTKIALENWLKYEMRKMQGINFTLIDFEANEGVRKGFIIIRFVSQIFSSMSMTVRHKMMEDILNNQMNYISRYYTFMHEEQTPEETIN